MISNKIVGEKVKLIRESKNISLEQLAERSGLTISQLSHIENDINIPSLSPLIKIARAMGVRLGTFLDDNNELGPVVSRKNEHTSTVNIKSDGKSTHKALSYHSLASSKSGRHMEPFVIDFEPHKEKDFIMSTHEGEEFIYIISGVLEITYGKDKYILEEGDSIYYDSIVPHHARSASDESAQILAIVYAPF
ncbi:MAG: helix-turn-helix transcriptional regulator [Breznakibacter sp.]|nr:helix-turn-helix transcriptional regulator [Breznakibacter sp.]